jgi:hypothetical protein
MFSRAYVPWPVKCLSFFGFMVAGRGLNWPKNVCKRCRTQVWIFALGGLFVVTALVALAYLL